MSASDDFEDAIEWFISLSETDKGRVIDEIESEEGNITHEEAGHLREIIITIQNQVEQGGTTEAEEALVDAGISEPYSVLLVDTVMEEHPPEGVIFADLNNLPRSDFDKLVERTLGEYYRYYEDELTLSAEDDLTTSKETLQNIVQQTLVSYLRGEGDLNDIQNELKSDIDGDRVEKIISEIDDKEDMIYDKLMYKNVYDILFSEIQDLKDEQRRTRGLMNEILDILEEAAKDSDT